MIEAIRRLVSLRFMPHGMCYLWEPWLVWLHVVSDILIALAYMTIPVALIYFVRRRRDIPFDWIFLCFGVFIVACGATHAIEAWNVWHANYLIAGGFKVATALASLPTAFLLVRLIPRALAIPSPGQLQRSEERFRMAARSGKMFVYEWNAATDALVRSGECGAILGVNEATSITGQQMLSKVHPDDRETVAAAIAALSPQEPDLRISYRCLLPDGAVIWVEQNSRAHFDERGKMLRMIGMVADISEQKRIEEKIHNLSYQLIRAQDTERRNIARDLHESAGQTLAALKMTLANVEDLLAEGSEEVRAYLKEARGFAEDAVREVRVVSCLMYPPLLDFSGLAPTLKWYVRGFAERSGIEADIKIAEDLGRHSEEIETAIFRVVQEALTNVYRHSGSSIVTICLARQGGQIRIEVRDQGCGLPPQLNANEQNPILGVGIAGMRERIHQLHGTFQIESFPGRGTTIRVALPLAEARCA